MMAPMGYGPGNMGMLDMEHEFSPLSSKEPTLEELRQTASLRGFLEQCHLYEEQEVICHREEVLDKLRVVVNSWVKRLSRHLGFDEASIETQRGLIFTFGSYRLGAHKPGGDIDVLCVGPQHCSREAHFFGRDEWCLEQMLRTHADVREVQPVPGAFIPVLKVDLGGIDLDIIFAPLPMSEVPEDLDIKQDSMLRGVDERTANTLNGTRVTDAVLDLVPNRDAFHAALKLVKKWAENRGIYANKLGLLGGINCAILVAKTCQWWPKASAAKVVRMFFDVYSEWPWPRPVLLTEIDYNNSLGHKVWLHQGYHNPYWDVMPIITPVYPAFNSTHNVCLATREVMVEEFKRGKEKCDEIFQSDSPDFSVLTEPLDFFGSFKRFIAIEISGKEPDHFKRWQGWVMARTRLLIQNVQELMCVRPWPEELVPPEEEEGDEEWKKCFIYLGVNKRKQPLFGWSPEPARSITLNEPVEQWMSKLYEFSDFVEGRIRDVKVTVNVVAREDLPAWVHRRTGKPVASDQAGEGVRNGMSEGPAPSDASDRRKRPRGEREGRGGAEAEGKEEQLWGRRGGGGAGETGGPQGGQGTGDGVGEGAGKRHRGTLGGEDGGAGECSLHSNLTGELQALDVEAEMEGGSGSGRS